MDRGALVGYSLWDRKELDTTEQLPLKNEYISFLTVLFMYVFISIYF